MAGPAMATATSSRIRHVSSAPAHEHDKVRQQWKDLPSDNIIIDYWKAHAQERVASAADSSG